jgi:putative tryptophan/tyrosine transport system substrate-binding protein
MIARRRVARLLVALPFLLGPGRLIAHAQQPEKVWRVSYLSLSAAGQDAIDAAFETAAKALGYVNGQNLLLDRRVLGTSSAGVDEVVAEVVRRNPDVIVAWAIQWSAAAKRATSTIPVVFVSVRAPVERGLVASLAKPGANLTGLSTFPLDAKLFELATELRPGLSRVAVLRSDDDPPGTRDIQASAARSMRVTVVPIPFNNDRDAANLGEVVVRQKAQTLIVPGTVLQFERRTEIVRATSKRVPTVFGFREAVDDGGLISLGLRTAKTLGLTIPSAVLLRADRVVE